MLCRGLIVCSQRDVCILFASDTLRLSIRSTDVLILSSILGGGGRIRTCVELPLDGFTVSYRYVNLSHLVPS